MNIFDLRTSTTELESSNQGVAKNTYEQVAPTRDCTGSAFPNGAIHFKFKCKVNNSCIKFVSNEYNIPFSTLKRWMAVGYERKKG